MSGSKFKTGGFYKNRFDCCDFVEVHEVMINSESNTEIRVTWYTQMHDGWRKLCTDQFDIPKKNYYKWGHYTPRGERVVLK